MRYGNWKLVRRKDKRLNIRHYKIISTNGTGNEIHLIRHPIRAYQYILKICLNNDCRVIFTGSRHEVDTLFSKIMRKLNTYEKAYAFYKKSESAFPLINFGMEHNLKLLEIEKDMIFS